MAEQQHPDEGPLHALLFTPDGRTLALDWQGVRAWRPERGVLWLHLSLLSEGTRAWIERDSGIPRLAAQGLLVEETRPRSTTFGDGALLQLRGVNLSPGADPEDMVSVRLWVENDRILSTRFRQLLSVQDVVETVRTKAPAGVGEVVTLLADRLIERMSLVIDDLEERVAQLEQRMLQRPDHQMRSQLAALRKEAITLRRYLAPQREALARLHSEPVSWLRDAERLRLREINDRLIRYIEDLDAARECAAVVHEELLSSLSEQLNSRMYVLSVAAAVFLPLGFLTGLLGINVGGIPGSESPWGFLIVLLILIVLVAAQVAFFRRKRWF